MRWRVEALFVYCVSTTDRKVGPMATWSVCTDDSGIKVYINLDNVLYLARYPGHESTTVMMVGGTKEHVQEEPDAIAIAGEDLV